MKRETAILTRKLPADYSSKGGWRYVAEEFEVRVLARSEGYAMVRRPRCAPFVCPEKDLRADPKLSGVKVSQ